MDLVHKRRVPTLRQWLIHWSINAILIFLTLSYVEYRTTKRRTSRRRFGLFRRLVGKWKYDTGSFGRSARSIYTRLP